MMSRWQIFSAVALRKLPEVRPKLDKIEERVQQIFDLHEVANSRYSDFELEQLEDARLKESDNIDVILKKTAQDKLDEWVKERSQFKFGEYDDRLSKTQYLFIKSKFGTDIKDQWLLPQAIYDSQIDSTLMDTARRALKDSLDIVNGYTIVSKIPSSSHKVVYPKKIQSSTGFKGAMVFYLKAHLDLPSASVLKAVDCSKNDRLKWLTSSEAFECVNKRYMGGLAKGLLHENRVDVEEVLVHAAKYVEEERLRQERLRQKLKMKI